MAVAALTGHGDPQVQELLPATVSPERVALVGMPAWASDDIANVAHWGIPSFSQDDLRATTQPLGDWLAGTGCSRVAIHFDVDTIDSNELVLGLGAEPDGLTTAQVRRIVDDLDAVTDVVGLTVAEFIPRQVMHLQQLLTGFPLLGTSSQCLNQVLPARAATHGDGGGPRRGTQWGSGQHSTAGLEPLTHDLQAEFVKTAERAQVRAHEGSVRHVASIGLRGMSRCRHADRVDWFVGVSARIR